MEDLVKDKKGKIRSLQNVKSTKKSLRNYVSAIKWLFPEKVVEIRFVSDFCGVLGTPKNGGYYPF